MNNLKKIREEKGLSLSEIGELIGSSKSYIWEIENFKSMPSIKKHTQYVRFLILKLRMFFQTLMNTKQKI